MSNNPFGVYNPEQLDAAYIAKNFVDVFTDLPRIRDPANTFILGARGTGKSMLLRSLEPAVMMQGGKVTSIHDLPYFSVHVPLKKAEFGVTELQLLAGYAKFAIGEHLLIMQVMFRIAQLLGSLANAVNLEDALKLTNYFKALFKTSGGSIPDPLATPPDTTAIAFERICKICELEIISVRQYYTRLAFSAEKREYKGALTGFLDFLVPIAQTLRRFSNLPDVPMFVMLDDADNLPQHLQRILNSWVSTRSTQAICLKITTQLGYATLRTVDNRVVESPHDFSEVNLSTIYTADNETYSNRVRQIVLKRFENAGIQQSLDEFFPKDEAQARRLREIEEEIRAEKTQGRPLAGSPRGSARVRDDVIRYAIPRQMRELAGSKRSSHTYSYAGFKSLVNLSSGVVRWFLEPASRMHDRVLSEQETSVTQIPVGVQDEIILNWSREFLIRLTTAASGDEGDGLPTPDPEASLHAYGHETELYDRLRNLLEGLGRLFRQRLLDSNASEQRLFSIILRDKPSDDVRQVLELGVRLGYLQRSDYAAKESFGGRVPRYILARRLGPYFRLDISGYAAHLSVTAQDLELAIRNPAAFVTVRLKETDVDDPQLDLDLQRASDGPANQN